ncbi:MAG TPA: hypothetical protein IGS53_17595 [Leptolyngbyaceae cyanobacterium M33_DOE_097]|nr:hypothetical protein [Leptolyngbyaceae cyanobacterium M33_DOE_097]
MTIHVGVLNSEEGEGCNPQNFLLINRFDRSPQAYEERVTMLEMAQACGRRGS